MSDPYLGEIRMVAFNFAPQGWQQCWGQIMSIAQNSALFSLLGTIYGGNGQTTFALPDLRGRSAVGMGQGLGLSNIDIGQIAGTENVSMTINNMPAHTHAATVTGGLSVTGNVSIPATTATTGEAATPASNTVLGTASASGRPVNLYSTSAANATLAPFPVTLTGASPSITNASTGGSVPVAIRNPYLGMNFIIAVSGIFPSRG
jgi:microcystin-dependent protein